MSSVVIHDHLFARTYSSADWILRLNDARSSTGPIIRRLHSKHVGFVIVLIVAVALPCRSVRGSSQQTFPKFITFGHETPRFRLSVGRVIVRRRLVRRSRRAAGCAALVLLLAGAGGASADTPPRLAYVRDSDVWVERRRLRTQRLTFSGAESKPAWSPDGSRIASVSYRDDSSRAKRCTSWRGDGSGARRITRRKGGDIPGCARVVAGRDADRDRRDPRGQRGSDVLSPPRTAAVPTG